MVAVTKTQNKESVNIWDYLYNLRSSVNILMLQAVAIVTVFIIWVAVSNNISTKLLLHICFTTIGYGFLMTESIILFSGDNFFGKTISRYHKVLIHAIFIGLGSILALIGISIEINSKAVGNRPHFKSTHGILGSTSMILMLLACVGGMGAAHVQRILKYMKLIPPIYYKMCHNFIGQSSYAIGLAAICYGLSTHTFKSIISWEQRTACVVVFIIVGSWTVMGAMLKQIQYIKTIMTR